MTQRTNEVSRLVVRDVSKTFGATRALSGADLEIRTGEVHTVMGENGSGKSTLVKIISGVHRADSGEVLIEGRRVDAMRSPAAARALGISTIFQEVLTIPGLSILENVWIGSKQADLTKSGAGRRPLKLLGQLLGEEIDVDEPIERLSISGRQATCIVRSLVQEPSLLVLDESTSALDVATRDRLFEVVRELTTRGVGALFISHRMDEVFQISDVITVLRGGQTVAPRLDARADVIVRPGQAHVRCRDQCGATRQPWNSRVGAHHRRRSHRGRHRAHLFDDAGGRARRACGPRRPRPGGFLQDALRGISASGGGTVTRHSDGTNELVVGPARARALGIGVRPPRPA